MNELAESAVPVLCVLFVITVLPLGLKELREWWIGVHALDPEPEPKQDFDQRSIQSRLLDEGEEA